ncbi:MAG: alpha/beta hydrolase [Bryobacteraceae bacterium]
MADQFIDVDGVRIRYQQAGRGTPILLLHGWGGSVESFYPVYTYLSQHFQTTTIDFPGHGQSAMPPRAWTVSDFLDSTMKLMDRLGLAQPHIVAHSFGGRVAIKLAAAHPERVGRILFTAGAGVKPPLSASQKIKKGLAVFKAAVPAPLRDKLPSLGSQDDRNAGALRPTLRNVVEEDLTPLLASIRSKCLLIWGDQDHDTPMYCCDTMHRLIPDNERVVFPGAGHFPYLDQSNKFNLLALKFFRGESE